MVSLRRRRLLGLCSGTTKVGEAIANGEGHSTEKPILGRSSFLAPLTRFFDNGHTLEFRFQNTKPVSVHPIPSVEDAQKNEIASSNDAPGSSNVSGSSSPKEQNVQQFPEPEVKRRKPHRRKHLENQEPFVMRGVYFKNMKWQAAIKVDKKQIHLGTVGSQEEAARLYDRAAFMCGREPNFELSEEEKRELRKFKWDEFLAITRSAITSKKHKRRSGPRLKGKSEPSTHNSDWEKEGEQDGNALWPSDDAEADASVL